MKSQEVKRPRSESSSVTFRAPRITLEQLDELARKWGENRSGALVRAIAIAHQEQKEKQGRGK